MAFFTASSCSLHSPLYHFPSQSSSSSSSSSRSRAMACVRQDEADFCHKRTLLFIGTSFLPLRGSRAKALEGLAIKGSAVKTPQYNQKHRIGSSYLFLSLMNQKCVNFSSTILGALFAYFVSRIELTVVKIAITRRNMRLKNQRRMIRFLESQLHGVVYQQLDREMRRFRSGSDEQNALIRELNEAYSTITNMEQNLQSQEDLIEELKLEIESLETQLANANAENEDVERSLKEKIDSVEILEDGSLKDKKDVEDFLKKLEDAQNLGLERESLESKTKNLEEELASAKSQNISSSKVVGNERMQKDEGESKFTVKKNVTQEKKG